jgi:hypothetical protein
VRTQRPAASIMITMEGAAQRGSRHIPGIRKAQEDVARITHVMVPQAKIAFSPLKSFATCTFARLAANYCPSVITPKIPLA